jgi:hypothetical protein
MNMEDFLELVAAYRRQTDSQGYDESEARIAVESGGFIVTGFDENGNEVVVAKSDCGALSLEAKDSTMCFIPRV